MGDPHGCFLSLQRDWKSVVIPILQPPRSALQLQNRAKSECVFRQSTFGASLYWRPTIVFF